MCVTNSHSSMINESQLCLHYASGKMNKSLEEAESVVLCFSFHASKIRVKALEV